MLASTSNSDATRAVRCSVHCFQATRTSQLYRLRQLQISTRPSSQLSRIHFPLLIRRMCKQRYSVLHLLVQLVRVWDRPALQLLRLSR